MLTDNVIADAYRGGLTCQEIADCCSIGKEYIRKRVIAAGVDRRPNGTKPNQMVRELVSRLIDTGEDFSEIARRAGCSVGLVSKVARLKGW